MASTYTTASGSLLIIPDSSIDVIVQNNPSGLAQSGVVAIVGEAEEGPSFAQDKANGHKLADNSFSPADIQRVAQKYGSGRIVDAFRGLATPSASARIQGAPNRIVVVKVNDSSAATLATLDSHGSFVAKRGGAPGNQIQAQVTTSQAELAPTTDAFSYVPASSSMTMEARVNGAAAQTLAITANMSPASLAAAITSSMSNMNAAGGVDRAITSGLSASNNISLSVVSGQSVAITLAAPAMFANAPAAGDTLRILSGSVIAGSGSANVGWFLVTSVTNTAALAQIVATKITAGSPLAVSSTALSATPANDLVDFSSMRIDNVSGTDRHILSSSLIGTNISAAAAASQITVSLASGSVFAATPRIGDSLFIPSSSVIAASSTNVGWYTVTEVSNTTSDAHIKASRISNGNPTAVSPTAIVAVSDASCLDPQIKGSGKALEIEDGAGSANIRTAMFNLATTTPASFLESMEVSSAEREIQIALKRTSTASNETFNNIGGNIAMTIGYNGATATATIAVVANKLTLTTAVTGGSGANLTIDLSTVSSINDLVTRINANTGYTAAAASALDGSRNPSVLDEVSAIGICSSLGNKPGRIKRDIFDLVTSASSPSNASSLASYSNTAEAGLPSDQAFAFFSNGSKGASSGLTFANAIDALQGVTCNFVVPLVSQDASADIAIADTDSASTYTVDGVNAAVRSHCIAMSTAKIKRHRIGVVSKRDSFEAAKAAASSLSNFRIAMTFQDVSDLNSAGDIQQFQPWMGALKAAGMQAAGAYKPMFNKTVNMVKAIQAAGDFDDGNVTDCEDAILAGMMPLQKQDTGGYVFLTDQMTYGLDNNIVYNSMQAVYISDLMALSLASSLKTAFVGESVADVTVTTAESFVKAKMAEFLFAKFTVATAAAPGGWKSISINISGNVLTVAVVAVLATGIKFIPITLSIEGINSSNAA